MPNQVEEFNDYRSGMNEKLPGADNKVFKRIFNHDTNAYSPGKGAGRDEVLETFAIATLVGGTIVIPQLRRAYEYWELLEGQQG